MIKNVSDPSIASILSTDALKVYTIPRYQREYTWGQRDWANLYDDVFDNDPGYFLGSIIVIQGEIDPKTNIVDFEVIDGQQRLTTISLLLTALYAGIDILRGGTYGLIVGYIFGVVGAIRWFFVIPAAPVLAVVVIALCVMVVYALAKDPDHVEGA